MRKLRRLCFKITWAWKHVLLSFKTEPWDSGYLHEYLIFFLEELKHDLTTCTFIEEKSKQESLKSLKLALKLLYKTKDEYHKFADLLDLKWGEPRLEFGELFNGCKKINIVRRNVKTEKDEELFNKEFKEAVNRDYRMEERDFKKALLIIAKYKGYWWT